ncbi:hypothetical protein [Pendulispora albinea]|uniref:Uncharacterized protein n=1 Tax=Pendulispora albinea TaxID=2741071 RepID=A0ABZ2MB30_9BACT
MLLFIDAELQSFGCALRMRDYWVGISRKFHAVVRQLADVYATGVVKDFSSSIDNFLHDHVEQKPGRPTAGRRRPGRPRKSDVNSVAYCRAGRT